MARWGMVIDLDRCTACQACVVACQVENNVPLPDAATSERGRAISWMRLAPMHEEHHASDDSHGGNGAPPRLSLAPVTCMHCENPPCTKVCPVGATQLDDDGFVGQIYPRCIGCRYCTTACPYTVREFNWGTPEWPEHMADSLSPDVSIRPKGVVEKCTSCHHRLQLARDRASAEGRELMDGDYAPACVETCPAGAMSFGDLDDPHSEATQLAERPRAFRLLEDLGTKPKAIYLAKGEWGG